MNTNTLASMGQALLANIAADLVTAGLPAFSRKVFAHGRPVHDGNCGQLAVWVRRVELGQGGDTTPRPPQGPSTMPYVPVVTFGVDINVCAAEINGEPSAADVTADGVLGARWLWSLMRVLTGRWKTSSMFDPYTNWTQLPGGKGLTAAGGDEPQTLGGLVVVTAALSVIIRGDLP